MFLNCNYPNELKIPKGRPKELKRIKLEMRQGKARLIVDMNDNVWLVDSSFYFGIDWECNQFRLEPEHNLVHKGNSMQDIKEITCRQYDGRNYYFCPTCQNKISKNDRFCRDCGQRLK